MTTLAIPEPIARQLLDGLGSSDETGYMLFAQPAQDDALLLVRELIPVSDDAYEERSPTTMRIRSTGFVPAFGQARRTQSAVIFAHTHPGGAAYLSKLDEIVDAALSDFAVRLGVTSYTSLIVGGTVATPRFAGRLHRAGKGPAEIERVRIAGNGFRVVLADGIGEAQTAPVFDRQVRAFGEAGQQLLQSLRVGVVGAGGTGSAVVEQLSRLGVGDIIVIDDDVVDASNLTRIHESTAADVDTSKAELAARRAREYGTDTTVTPIHSTVATADAVDILAGCDVVMGCTDDNAGRLVINRLAFYYLVPVVDCAVVVDVGENQTVRGVFGRVTTVAPGEPCLLCRNQIDVALAGEEMLDDETRKARAGEGYARGAQAPAPSVIAFTTAVASLAVNELLGRVLGYGTDQASQLLINFHDQTIRRVGRSATSGHMCVDPEQWGLGDSRPRLGLSGL